MLTLTPASDYSVSELNDIWTAGFEGYFVPIASDVTGFCARMASDHIDLSASFVAVVDGQPAGLTLIARRGARARVCSMSVASAHRRSGAGRTMMTRAIDDSRDRGDEELCLEVITVNRAAKLYESCGFQIERELLGFVHRSAQDLSRGDAGSRHTAEALEQVEPHVMADAVAGAGGPLLPWQLQPASLYAARRPAQCWRLGPALALGTPAGDTLHLRAMWVPPAERGAGHGRRILGALAAKLGVSTINVAGIVPAGLVDNFMARYGFERAELAQWEMVRRH